MEMHRARRLLIIFVTTLCMLAGISAIAVGADSFDLYQSIDINAIRDTVLDLSSMGSRIAGYPGAKLAEEYVIKRFQDMGLEVRTQDVPITTPVDRGASLRVLAENVEYELYSFWPNGVRTTTVPPEGLEGRLLYVGRGEFRELNGLDLEGSIVLMDFVESHWTNALYLGARAVIFIEPDEALRGHFEGKFLDTPINMPRFYIDRETGLALKEKCLETNNEGIVVNLNSRMDWVKSVNKNIMAYLEGSDPELKDEIVIIQGYYDSMSTVPKLAPGAEQALGISVLFEIAESFIEYRPKRTIMFLATPGHGMGLAGSKVLASHQMKLDTYRNKDGSIDWDKLNKAFDTLQREKALGLPEYPVEDYLNGQLLEDTIVFSIDLTSRNDVFGLFYTGHYWNLTGDVPNPTMVYSDFGRKDFQVYAAALTEKLAEVFGEDDVLETDPAASLLSAPYEKYFVDTINRAQGRGWWTHMGASIGFDSETFTIAGATGLGFATTNDARPFIDTPLDTIDRIDFDNVEKQARFLCGILWDFVNDPEISSPVKLKGRLYTIAGETVHVDPRDNFMPSPIEPGAIVTYMKPANTRTMTGIRTRVYDITEYSDWTTVDGEHGAVFFFPGATSNASGSAESAVLAFKLDEETGDIIEVTDFGREGRDKYKNTFDRFAHQFVTLVLFEAKSLELYDLMDQRYFSTLSDMRVYDAMRDATPDEYSAYMGPNEPVAMAFVKEDTPIKITMHSGLVGLRFAVLNSSEEQPYGVGFDLGEYDKIQLTSYKGATDLWLLNDSRIQVFESYGIENHRVRELHDMAKEKLDQARIALENRQYDLFVEYARAAWANVSRAYPEVTGTMDDSVKGIMFYLAMLLPFAFFLERLMFAFPDIKKQIVAALGIFTVIFMIMRYIHPAFELALTPAILLLAFVIMTLTFLVIWIIGGKFEEEIAKLRPKRAGVERVDVGRAAASSVAFALGIENMRKRRVRTVLTCITLVILTFTVISFTSLKAYLRHNRVSLGKEEAPFDGILLRGRSWEAMSDYVRAVIDNKYARDNLVIARSWYMTMTQESARQGEKSYVDIKTDTAKTTIDAVVGMMAEEKELQPVEDTLIAGRWFEEGDYNVAILSDNVASKLGITEDDIGEAIFRINGFDVTVIGLFDSEKFTELKGLDGEELTPVDYSAMLDMMMMGGQQTADISMTGGEDEAPMKYTHLTADNVVLMPYRFTRDIGGSLRAVVVKAGENSNIQEMVEDLITRVSFYIYVGMDGEKYVYSSTGMTAVQGASNVFIPLLIAALIVLNTMLGSVYERTREIEIYSAVGLAPSHISALFMAESCVYAVLGAVSGYVIGQTISKIVTHFDLLPGLNLNYSSMSTVGSTGLVMAVVLISTIYPARQASRLAAPAIERKWKLPEPVGDNLKAILPFTLSEGEAMGASIFLKDFAEGHDEQSVGNFQAREIKLYSEPDENNEPKYVLQFIAHLAPYDLGVMQDAKIVISKIKDKKEHEVLADITRLAGDIPNWKRANLLFITEIRKQFLIWRTVQLSIKDEYERRAREALERG